MRLTGPTLNPPHGTTIPIPAPQTGPSQRSARAPPAANREGSGRSRWVRWGSIGSNLTVFTVQRRRSRTSSVRSRAMFVPGRGARNCRDGRTYRGTSVSATRWLGIAGEWRQWCHTGYRPNGWRPEDNRFARLAAEDHHDGAPERGSNRRLAPIVNQRPSPVYQGVQRCRARFDALSSAQDGRRRPGRNKPARGNATGTENPPRKSPERAAQGPVPWPTVCRPFWARLGVGDRVPGRCSGLSGFGPLRGKDLPNMGPSPVVMGEKSPKDPSVRLVIGMGSPKERSSRL